MSDVLRSRATVVWLLLVAATVFSYASVHGVVGSDVRVASVIVIVVAFVKVRFVMFEFMELRGAPVWMQRAGDAWIVVIAGALIARLLIGA